MPAWLAAALNAGVAVQQGVLTTALGGQIPCHDVKAEIAYLRPVLEFIMKYSRDQGLVRPPETREQCERLNSIRCQLGEAVDSAKRSCDNRPAPEWTSRSLHANVATYTIWSSACNVPSVAYVGTLLLRR